MAEELAKAASSDTMLRNLTLTGVSTLQDGCLEIYRRRTRLQSALVDQCMFFTQFVAKTTQAITPKTERPRFSIGIIGCGLVGRQLVDTLLERGYPPEDIAISTRSPHTLTHLTDMGIRVAHDNALVSSQSRLLFILCLPAQLPTVVASMKGHVRRRCLIVSTVLGVDERKLMNLLRTNIVVCARTHADFARMEIAAALESMDKYRQELLDEALGKEPVVATTYDSESDGDSVAAAEQAALAAVDDAAAAARTTGTEADAIVAGVTSHARKDSHSGGVDGDDGEEHKARPGASTEADIIADAVHQESLHSRAQRLRTATAATKDKVEKAWADAYEADKKREGDRESSRQAHVERLMQASFHPAEDGDGQQDDLTRVAALHLCRQEEQLRRLFVVLAYFAMKCGIPRDFAQLLACQELLGVDSADTTFVVERARQAVARKHRRKSGLGPVVHRGATNDVPTMEFPLATFLVQAKLPMFWTQFLAGVQNSYALQASQGDPAVDARRRSSAAKDGRRRSSGVRRGAGTAPAAAGT